MLGAGGAHIWRGQASLPSWLLLLLLGPSAICWVVLPLWGPQAEEARSGYVGPSLPLCLGLGPSLWLPPEALRPDSWESNRWDLLVLLWAAHPH